MSLALLGLAYLLVLGSVSAQSPTGPPEPEPEQPLSLLQRGVAVARSSGVNVDFVRLTYLAGHGRAEQCRWMLAAAGIEWEQVALTSRVEFLQLQQEKLLFGQLPLLEIDGLELVQSNALFRYVAQREGLWGKDLAEAATVDMLAEGVRDAREVVLGFPFAVDQDASATKVPARVARQMAVFEAWGLSQAGGRLGFLASGLCAADVLVAELVEELLNICPQAIAAEYPTLVALHGQVVARPSIAAYLASDKRFPFPKGAARDAYVQNVQAVLGPGYGEASKCPWP